VYRYFGQVGNEDVEGEESGVEEKEVQGENY
jgi:hypothetical protein